jgi:hypothetical protein
LEPRSVQLAASFEGSSVELPIPAQSISIVSLKNRTLGPVAKLLD